MAAADREPIESRQHLEPERPGGTREARSANEFGHLVGADLVDVRIAHHAAKLPQHFIGRVKTHTSRPLQRHVGIDNLEHLHCKSPRSKSPTSRSDRISTLT